MAQFNIDENGHCVIPIGTTEIGEKAFMNCDSLKSVEIPDSVPRIEDGAFDGCI